MTFVDIKVFAVVDQAITHLSVGVEVISYSSSVSCLTVPGRKKSNAEEDGGVKPQHVVVAPNEMIWYLAGYHSWGSYYVHLSEAGLKWLLHSFDICCSDDLYLLHCNRCLWGWINLTSKVYMCGCVKIFCVQWKSSEVVFYDAIKYFISSVLFSQN